MHFIIEQMSLLATQMDVLVENLNPLVFRMNDLLGGSEEDIAKIIANLHETSANVRDMTHDLKFRPWRLVRKNS